MMHFCAAQTWRHKYKTEKAQQLCNNDGAKIQSSILVTLKEKN